MTLDITALGLQRRPGRALRQWCGCYDGRRITIHENIQAIDGYAYYVTVGGETATAINWIGVTRILQRHFPELGA